MLLHQGFKTDTAIGADVTRASDAEHPVRVPTASAPWLDEAEAVTVIES